VSTCLAPTPYGSYAAAFLHQAVTVFMCCSLFNFAMKPFDLPDSALKVTFVFRSAAAVGEQLHEEIETGVK
jgi:hypothetical protein